MTDPQETTTEATIPQAAVATPDETTETAATDSPTPAAARNQQVLTPRAPAPYAVIETGGKQYRVSVGDVLSVEKLDQDAGTDITFDRVLLVSSDGATRVGTPTVAGATVVAAVQEQYRGEKLVIFKFKAKKRYRRRTGHRQSLTRLAITAINA